MNRIILLVIGLSTVTWMLRDLIPVDDLAFYCVKRVSASRDPGSEKAARPCCVAPALMPKPTASTSPIRAAAIHLDKTIAMVMYAAPVQEASPASDTDDPDLAEPQADATPGDRAALGKWVTGLLGRLIKMPPAATRPASANQPKDPQSNDAAQQPNGTVQQPAEHIALQSTPATTPTPPAPNASATEKPADIGLPVVTATISGDALATDEKPAAAGPAVDKAVQTKSPAPAATIPPIDQAGPTPVVTPAAKPLDAEPTDSEATPSATSPAVTQPTAAQPAVTYPTTSQPVLTSPAAVSPEATPTTTAPQPIAPAPGRVAPVRRPLTPEQVALWQKVHYALAMYQHQRLLNTGKNVPWEVMHRLVAYGADTEVLRDGPGGEPVNAIGWLLWGGRCGTQPLMVLNGGRPMAMIGVGVQGHAGQFLGMLAQSHVRPESPFQLQGQRFTVRDLIEQEKLGMEANTELTFELIAMSYYAKSDDVWTARTGEQWSISRLVHEEIKQPIQGAACGGSHRLFGLSSAYKMRIAEGKPVDGEFLRAQKYIRSYQNYTLGRIENRDGSFSTDWFARPADNGDLDRKIQTTGHILEWLVFSLEDSQLRDPRVVANVDFLATQIATHPNRAWSIGPLGHALHALAIYETRVFVRPYAQPQQQAATARQPKADLRLIDRPVARPAMRPSIGTPNAASATAELQGPDLGVKR